MKRKLIAAAVAATLAGSVGLAQAQKLSGDAVKIGVLTDMSGVYADYGGPGAVAMNVISNLCDNITVLARGSVLAEGPYAQVSKDPRVLEAYVGSSEEQHA